MTSIARPTEAALAFGRARRTRKTLVALASAVLLALSLGACQSPDRSSDTSTESLPPVATSTDPFRADGFTIGVANYSLATPYLAALNKAMEDRATEVGAKVVSKDAGGDPEKLSADVTDLLAEGVDGIIVSGGDLVSVPGVSLAMKDSQVSLVYVDRLFDSGFYNASIGPDYVTLGWDSADFIGNTLGARGKVAMIKGGPATNPIGLLIDEGFVSCFQEMFPEMTLVESGEFGDWSAEGGERVMNSLLAEHGDIVAVFCQNDAMCLGAQQAAADAGRSHEMIFTGVGGTSEGFKAVMDGTNFVATSLVNPDEIGLQGVNTMVSIFQRRDYARSAYVPTPLVRHENAAEYYDEERAY